MTAVLAPAATLPAAPPPRHEAAASSPLALPGSDELPRKLWTRDEYHHLLEQGFLIEGSRFELLEGEIVAKMPQDRKHIVACMRGQQALMGVFGVAHVQTQGPIAPNDYNEPEPDIVVLRNRVQDYMEDHPGPADILLAVEVANTSLRADRTVKRAVYARAGIPEYWLMDVNGRTLTVFREPGPDGWASETTLTDADAVSPLAAPDAPIAVADLLPPPAPPAP